MIEDITQLLDLLSSDDVQRIQDEPELLDLTFQGKHLLYWAIMANAKKIVCYLLQERSWELPEFPPVDDEEMLENILKESDIPIYDLTWIINDDRDDLLKMINIYRHIDVREVFQQALEKIAYRCVIMLVPKVRSYFMVPSDSLEHLKEFPDEFFTKLHDECTDAILMMIVTSKGSPELIKFLLEKGLRFYEPHRMMIESRFSPKQQREIMGDRVPS